MNGLNLGAKSACVLGLSLLVSLSACLTEDGKGGEAPIDCGEHGSAHAGHCHCDHGFLFDGTTCVSPDAITQECQEHDDEHADEHADEHEHHHHGACVCPAEGTCPCDGEVESIAGKDYCIPDLHAH